MRGTIEVWGYPKCEVCRAAKARLRGVGFVVEERDLGQVQSGDLRDVEILTQITLQDGYAPVIRVLRQSGMEFVRPEHLEQWLTRKDG